MIKLLLFTVMLNAEEIQITTSDDIKIEANRKRGKNHRGRKGGGRGLR